MVKFTLNGQEQTVDVEPDTPLLWVLRETLGMTGTKFGCGMALCGACTIHLDGVATRSCMLPVGEVEGAQVTTIEGLAHDGHRHPLQQAWIDENVPQCGYCQSGQIMAAAALLKDKPQPSDDEINRCMAGNLCRCGTYPRIKKAIQRASLAIVSPVGDEKAGAK